MGHDPTRTAQWITEDDRRQQRRKLQETIETLSESAAVAASEIECIVVALRTLQHAVDVVFDAFDDVAL